MYNASATLEAQFIKMLSNYNTVLKKGNSYIKKHVTDGFKSS